MFDKIESIADDYALNISLAMIFGIFILYFLCFVGFIFHICINAMYPIISLFSSFIIFSLLSLKQHKDKKYILKGLLLLSGIIVLAGIIPYYLWDSSYDGRWYHQTNIILLAEGWNPIYTDVQTFMNSTYNTFLGGLVWCEHYTKFLEIIAASVYKLTNNIEIGKIFNILINISLFGYAYYVLNKNFLNTDKADLGACLGFTPRSRSFAYGTSCLSAQSARYPDFIRTQIRCLPRSRGSTRCSLSNTPLKTLAHTTPIARVSRTDKKLFKLLFPFLLVINPVVLAQIFTYYVDGVLYSLFIIALLALINISASNKISIIHSMVFIFSSAMMLNIKFGAYFLFFTMLAVYIVLYLVKKDYFHLKQLTTCTLFIIILICLSGINPYYTNIKQGKHILYPVLGTTIAQDFFKNDQPIGFNNMPCIKSFLISTFSKVDFLISTKAELKMPFTIHKKEFIAMAQPNQTLSGFGALWSGIFILTIILLLLLIKNKKLDGKILPILFVLLFSSLFNPASYYARYIPQFYAFVCFVLLYAFVNFEDKYIKCINVITLFLIIINSMIVGCAATYKSIFYYTIPIKKQLAQIEETFRSQKRPIEVYFTHELSFIAKIKARKIKFVCIETEPVASEYNKIFPSAGQKGFTGNVLWK